MSACASCSSESGRRIAELNGFLTIVLRANNNSLSLQVEDDPRGAYDAAANGLAMARRFGQAGWIHGFAGNLGYAGLRVGEWDTAVAELQAALEDATDPFDRINPINNLVNYLALRGEPHEALLAELEGIARTEPAPAHQVFLLESQGYAALSAGDLRATVERWRAMADVDPAGAAGFGVAAKVAVWLDSAEEAEVLLRRFWETNSHGGAARALRTELEASLAGLRGDRVAAGLGYREALRIYRDLRIPLDEAFLAIGMAYVLGPSDPSTAEAVTGARAFLTSLRAGPLLRILDEAVATGPHARLRPVATESAARDRATSATESLGRP